MSTNSTINLSDDFKFDFYKYTPNLGASIAFAVLFLIAAIIITGQLWILTKSHKQFLTQWMNSPTYYANIRHYNTFKLFAAHIPLIVGCIIEVVGYIARSVSRHDVYSLPPFAVQVVLLLVGPTLYAASIYMVFGRMAHLMFVENLMIMPARFNTVIFVLGDVASLLLQAAGGGMQASASTEKAGSNIVTVGLFIQIAFFGIFMINEFLFVIRVRALRNKNKIASKSNTWIYYNWILIVNSAMILVRSIVRTVEFIQGYDGYITSHEYFLYIFDATPMFLLPLITIVFMMKYNIFEIQRESIQIQSELDKDYESEDNDSSLDIEADIEDGSENRMSKTEF
ncbi:hypothetical protein B1J92_K00715g [Nakaseomyces glabratus]|nr:hypothetical protein B1J91_K00715g [Nakaseomyces glabratus]OXB46628.1 hypothetical protein B1J92_K00715g [Nakaseomyces glabratus]